MKKNSSKQDNFSIDVKDTRFDQIFDHPDFAIDPTSKLYNKTEAMETILAEKRQRSMKKYFPTKTKNTNEGIKNVKSKNSNLDVLKTKFENFGSKT